jgi:hypothetical protein
MEPLVNKDKKRIRKTTEDIRNYPSQVQYPSYREEEDLLDYEPESPELYPDEEDAISKDFDEFPAQEDGPGTIIQSATDLTTRIFSGSWQRARVAGGARDFFVKGRQAAPQTAALRSPDRTKVYSPLTLVMLLML